MFYVYVLQSLKDKGFYIGFTRDLKARIINHRAGKVISTRKRLPIRLIFYEAYLKFEDAYRRERYLKTTRGRTALKTMLKEFLRTY